MPVNTDVLYVGETVEFVIRQKKNKTNDWINAAHVFREPVSFLR